MKYMEKYRIYLEDKNIKDFTIEDWNILLQEVCMKPTDIITVKGSKDILTVIDCKVYNEADTNAKAVTYEYKDYSVVDNFNDIIVKHIEETLLFLDNHEVLVWRIYPQIKVWSNYIMPDGEAFTEAGVVSMYSNEWDNMSTIKADVNTFPPEYEVKRVSVRMRLKFVDKNKEVTFGELKKAISEGSTDREIRKLRLLTFQEVADRWGVSIPTIHKYIKQGKLDKVAISDRVVRIKEESILAIEEGTK